MARAFDDKSLKRIRDAVLRNERYPRNLPQKSRRYPIIPGCSGGKVAFTTSTIPAMSGTTPGSGQANLYTFDGTSLNENPAGNPVNVYNSTSGSVASGVWIQVKLIDNYWFVDVASC